MTVQGKKRVLIIDDDVKLCRLVKDYLAPFGFEVDAVHDGNAGLERLRSDDADAVILDVMLPETDGFNVLRQLAKALSRRYLA